MSNTDDIRIYDVSFGQVVTSFVYGLHRRQNGVVVAFDISNTRYSSCCDRNYIKCTYVNIEGGRTNELKIEQDGYLPAGLQRYMKNMTLVINSIYLYGLGEQ